MKKTLVLIVSLLFFYGKMSSTHIVGGELFYDKLNNSDYKVTLKVYRDCNAIAPYQGLGNASPAILAVYAGDYTLVDTFDIGVPVVTSVSPAINNVCITPPGGICVEQGVYTYTLNLPPKTGGYYLVYQFGFRNNTILNLANPNSQGSTYYIFVPGPEQAASNSSPRFNNFPPIFICNKILFTFNHAATDPDGDQLVYSLCAPYQGMSLACPNFTTPGCPSQPDPPPYVQVNYTSPYSGAYPMASNPAISINPSTGILTVKPTLQGQFVVGVCVQEIKAGVLINTHYRDFQFNVVNCLVQVASDFEDQLNKCAGSSITFTNQSFGNAGNLSYLWDFGVTGISTDTSAAFNPTYTYPDTGKYEVTLIANPGKPCSDTIKKTVYVYPELSISFPPVSRQCFRENAFTFSVQGVYASYATFLWDFTSAATPSASILKNPFNVTFSQPGKYFVKLSAKQAVCIDSFIDSVRVIAPPLAKINNLPGSWCDPAHVAFINGSSSELPVTYQWFFSNGNTSQSFEPMQVFTPPGVYSATLIVKTSTICVDTSIASVKNITVTPAPKAGFSFSPQVTTIFDPEINFMNLASSDVNSWQYSFGDGSGTSNASDIHVYQQYGDYNITQIVFNSFNCSDTAIATVKILPEFRFWIPNTFTPDGNLINDHFMPIAIGVEDYEFDVFTRWGELIYRTQNPKEGWNGFYKGEECKEDVYVWRIVFKNVVSSRDEIHYGHVALLKNK